MYIAKMIMATSTLLFALGPVSRAEIRVSAMFSDHMVLQRGMAAPVWGTAEPGERVEVRFAGQVKQATANEDGR